VNIESARPPYKCVLRRSASGGRTGSACAARHTPTQNALVGRSGRPDISTFYVIYKLLFPTHDFLYIVYIVLDCNHCILYIATCYAPDTTRRSCLCGVLCAGVNWRCPGFVFSVGDSLELSGIQFALPKRTRHRQDSFVVSGVAV